MYKVACSRLPLIARTLLPGYLLAVLLGYSDAFLDRDAVAHLMRFAVARYYWYVDTLLVLFRVAFSVLDLHTLLFGDWMADLARDLARNGMTVSLRYGHTELLGSRVTLSVRDWVTFFTGLGVTVFVDDRLAMLSRFGMRNTDTFLAWNRFTFLLRNGLAALSWFGGTLDLPSDSRTLLLINGCADLGRDCFTDCFMKVNALLAN